MDNKVADFRLQTDEGLFNIQVDYDQFCDSPREWDDTNASNMICFHSRYNLGDEHNYSDIEDFLAELIEEKCSGTEDVLMPFFEKSYGNITYVFDEDNKGYDVLYTDEEGNEFCYCTIYTDDIKEDFEREIEGLKESFLNEEWKDILSINEKLEIIEKHIIILPLYLYDHSGITMNTTGFTCGWDSGQVGWIYSTVEDYNKIYGGEWTTEKVIEDLKGEVKVYDQYLRGEVYWFLIEKIEVCECCSTENEEQFNSCGGFYGMEQVVEAICEEFDKKYHDEVKSKVS